MASDIVNTAGTTTGNQKMGDAVVNLPGRNGQEDEAHQFQADRQITVPVVDIHDKYDDRYDDPRYYTGDTPS